MTINDVNNVTTWINNAKNAAISASTLTNTTYSNLTTLINQSKLIPGTFYRITDYVTTTIQSDTQSANHAFDVIVTADSTNKLNANARAIQHSGDTYFNGQKLESWELKYDINNDTDRFAWADSTNGKGVIYYMKDEYGNEAGYDFKNIQMKYYKITATTTATDLVNTYSASRSVGNSSGALIPPNCTIDSSDFEWRYTFDLFINNTHKDYSLNNYSSDAKYCYNNKINDLYNRSSASTTTTKKQKFINIISFRNTETISSCYGNTFGNRNYNFSFGNSCISNSFGNDCTSNSFGNSFYYNSFGNFCYSNNFGDYCYSNSFGNSCNNNRFGSNCSYNSFGNNCSYNSFGNTCHSNSFGNNCYNNSFGNSYYSNSFGNICESNTFGNNCISNTFGNVCRYNSFGNSCRYNILPNSAYSAIFNDSTNYKYPKFNIGTGDPDYGFISSGDIDTSDTSNPKIYVYGKAFNIGDFDITVQIPYEFSGDITAKAGSSLTGTYTLTVSANDSVDFEISAIVSSVEEAEGSWDFNAEFDYLLGSTNIHYVGYYSYY